MQVQYVLLFQNSKCSTCCYFILKPNRLVDVVVRDVVVSGSKSESRGDVGVHPPPAIFMHVFDEYNFSIISNLFNNNKPQALTA